MNAESKFTPLEHATIASALQQAYLDINNPEIDRENVATSITNYQSLLQAVSVRISINPFPDCDLEELEKAVEASNESDNDQEDETEEGEEV